MAVGGHVPRDAAEAPRSGWWPLVECFKRLRENEKNATIFVWPRSTMKKLPPLTEYRDKIVLWTLATMTNIVMPHGIP